MVLFITRSCRPLKVGIIVSFCSLLLVLVPCALADSATAFSVSVSEFSRLNPDEQRKIIGEAFLHRLAHGKNIYYDSLLTLRNHKYKDGVVGAVVWDGVKYGYRHWRLGDSYRMDTDVYGRPAVTKPVQLVSSSFDADEGVGRGTIRLPGAGQMYARTDVVHSPITFSNRYSYWLDGKRNNDAEHLFRYFVDHRSEFLVDAPFEATKVRLTVPWLPYEVEGANGTWQLVLDPAMGFLPVRGYGSWKTTKTVSSKSEMWRHEAFVVNESRLVADVWMPIKLREVVEGSSLGAGLVNVWDTEILRIEHGNVTPENLVVPFPQGTTVVDAVKGYSYKADKHGNPDGPVRSFIGAAAVSAMRPMVEKQAQPNYWRNGLIAINIGIVMALVSVFLIRRRKASVR